MTTSEVSVDASGHKLVECVPNFSEGRRPDVMQALVNAILTAPVHVIDTHADADHNRMVVTFVGEPEAVLEAAFSGAQAASVLINLEEHSGVHPRIGATDVIPFIPLRNVSYDECIVLARRLGQRIADELTIPVYLYEKAAVRPERVDLANVRKWGYEWLKTAIQSEAEYEPDFGNRVLTGAGATAVGVRSPLIAFNVYLDTADVETAKAIARGIRASNGGLPAVKAIGVLVGGKAQVSINLTDYRVTSLYTLMNAVRSIAQQLGVDVSNSELVGLVPQSALIDYAIASLGLPQTAREQVLEKRLGAATSDYREPDFGSKMFE